jgi:hypothetical protein
MSNRLLPLDNKYDPQEGNSGILPHRKYKNFKLTRKDKASCPNHHQAIKNNDEQPIPTIMNGAICVNNSEKHSFKYNDAIYNRINILSKSIIESNSYITDLSNKHGVVLVGNSHIRGYGGNLTSVLSKTMSFIV